MDGLTAKQFLLVDAIGALVSASLLLFLLVPYQNFFGMPEHIVRVLAYIALGFATYSFLSFLFSRENAHKFLRLIALLNTLYCLLTGSLVIYHTNELTSWGILYFIGEIILIIFLVQKELQISRI